MNFQGRLTNASGTALTGSHDMQFKLYTAVTGGTYVWGETRTAANGNTVTVTGGLFNVLIGEGTAVAGSSASLQAAVTANSTLYIEIMVGSETLTPRSQFGSSAYAINSDMIDGIDGASLAQLTTGNAFTNTNSITTSNASAFVVNNGTSNIFKVDTSGTGRVVVGTSDANGTVFVLDSNASDPTGTNGAMYYNSGGKFRCYEGGVWKDCITAATTSLQDAYNNDASGVADIATSSTAKTFLFKAGATFDATALFDIQNAAGTSLFTVDSTTNNRVYIGDSVADSTGTVLVLDTKDSATNPAGVDGAMYYNSNEKSFRCYKNGLWGDCNFASLRSEWVVQEEFANISTTTLSTGSQGWTGAAIASGTAAKLNVGGNSNNYDRFGVLQLASAATSVSSGWNIRLDTTGMTGVRSNMTVEFDFGPVSTNAALGTNQTTYIGLHNGTNTTSAPSDGMYFRYTAGATAGSWDRCVQAVCATTGVARTLIAQQYQRFKIQTNAAGTAVEFFINEASVGTVSSGLPTQATGDVYGPSITSFTSTTAPTSAMQWKIDYFQIKRNLTTLR